MIAVGALVGVWSIGMQMLAVCAEFGEDVGGELANALTCLSQLLCSFIQRLQSFL